MTAAPATTAIVAALVLLAAGSEAHGAGRELARTGALAPTYRPVGFAGVDVLAIAETRLTAFGSAGPTILAGNVDRETAIAGGGTLAFVTGGRVRDVLLAGALAGPLRAVLSCPASGRLAPVLAGALVVWTACDQRSLIVADASVNAGQVVFSAAGRVAAIAADSDRVAWVAADDAEQHQLTVYTRELSSGATTTIGSLGPVTDEAFELLSAGPAGELSIVVAVAQDGRVLASRQDAGPGVVCTTLSPTEPARPRTLPRHCPRHVVFTGEGSVESQVGDGKNIRGAVRRRARSGAVLGTIVSSSSIGLARPFATDGGRIAVSLSTCRGARLVAGDLATARFAKPACAIRPIRRVVRATRAGLVRIAVRCPQGCLGVGGGMDLRLRGVGRVFEGDGLLDLQPGRSGHVVFRLTPGQRRALHRRGSVAARVSIIGYADRTSFDVRVRAARG